MCSGPAASAALRGQILQGPQTTVKHFMSLYPLSKVLQRRGVYGEHEVLPPNGCVIFHKNINNIIVSGEGEAILSVENSGKPLGGRGSAPNPAGELRTLSQTPSWWAGGCCPSPRTPSPLSVFGLGSISPAPMKNPVHAPA